MADFKPAGADGDFQAWAKHHAKGKQLHDLQIAEGKQGDGDAEVSSAHLPVSYTHLTLPTKA